MRTETRRVLSFTVWADGIVLIAYLRAQADSIIVFKMVLILIF